MSGLDDGLGELVERFDHVCIAVHSIAVAGRLAALMGGELIDGADAPGGYFRWVQFRLPGGAKVEMIEPIGDEETFLTRFLEASGEGLHHITLKVHDLAAAVERARNLGFEVTGVDTSQSNWREAFVHPRDAHGVLVQLAEWTELPDRRDITLADVTEGLADRYA